MSILETRNLTKYYGKARGIIDVDLSIEQGDMFGFIGPNGAGKSTTIRLLLGLIKPTSGEAGIFEKNCFKQSREILANIGYMPSETQFYGNLKVSEVIDLSARLYRKDCTEEAIKLCERFQLDKTRKMEDLSLGNRKKVSIICALQHDPELIILDEPTSGLDPLMQKEFFDVLKERNSQGRTIFFSSHVLPEIQNHCRNAAIIKDGKLIRTAPVSELTATSAKIITLMGITEALHNRIISSDTNIGKVKNITLDGDKLKFMYGGDTGTLLQFLNDNAKENDTAGFKDVTITEPSLEEIFIHYYE